MPRADSARAAVATTLAARPVYPDRCRRAASPVTIAPSQHHSPVGQEHGRTIPLGGKEAPRGENHIEKHWRDSKPLTCVHDTAWIAELMGDLKVWPSSEWRCAERPIWSSMTSSAKTLARGTGCGNPARPGLWGAGGNLLAYPADHVGSSPVYPRKLTTFCTAQVESDQERTSGRAPMLPNLHERGSACSTTPPDADPRQRGARSRSFSAL